MSERYFTMLEVANKFGKVVAVSPVGCSPKVMGIQEPDECGDAQIGEAKVDSPEIILPRGGWIAGCGVTG